MDDAVLIEAIKKHKETCFKKSTCKICRYKIYRNTMCEPAWDGYDITQCDICGCVYDPDELEERHYRYDCKCNKAWIYVCGITCKEMIPFDIIEDPTDEDSGVYQDVCCPLTKGTK